jgi:transposase InsO family protein
MQVAPSGYWRYAAQQRNAALRCARVQRDDVLSVEIERVWQANLQVYGADKVWRQLRREGTAVARCTLERLMRQAGLRGMVRGKVVRTTVADAKAPCPLDRVNRQFKAQRPNQFRRLACQQLDANRLRPRCAGTGALRPLAGTKRVGPSQR